MYDMTFLRVTSCVFVQITDWHRNMSVSGEMALEVAFYNEKLSVWEPLIEPVEDTNHHRPWQLSLTVGIFLDTLKN